MPKGMPEKHNEGKVVMPKGARPPHIYGGEAPNPMDRSNRLEGVTPQGGSHTGKTQAKSDGKFAGPGKGANKGSMGGTPASLGGMGGGSNKAVKGPHNY